MCAQEDSRQNKVTPTSISLLSTPRAARFPSSRQKKPRGSFRSSVAPNTHFAKAETDGERVIDSSRGRERGEKRPNASSASASTLHLSKWIFWRIKRSLSPSVWPFYWAGPMKVYLNDFTYICGNGCVNPPRPAACLRHVLFQNVSTP